MLLALFTVGLAEVRAAPTCGLLVHVLDETGNSISGAAVRVKVGTEVLVRNSGDGGLAQLPSLPCGEALIEVGQPTMAGFSAWAGTTRALRPDLPATARIVIVPRTEVTIRVLDASGRTVVSGLVEGSSKDGSGPLGSPGEKGLLVVWLQPGSWHFDWIGENTSQLHGLPGRWISLRGRGVDAAVGRQPIVVDLVIDSSEQVGGRVLDANGQAIPGISVFARDPTTGDFWAVAQTSEQGSFLLELSKLPAILEPVSSDRPLSFDPPRLAVQETRYLTGLLLERL